MHLDDTASRVWRVAGRVAWASAALIGFLIALVPAVAPMDVALLMGLVWFAVIVMTLEAARRRGLPLRRTRAHSALATASIVLAGACLGALIGMSLAIPLALDASLAWMFPIAAVGGWITWELLDRMAARLAKGEEPTPQSGPA